MSDHSISIVPRISNYLNNAEKADEIVAWLVSRDIVKPDLSDCTLGDSGYAISEGAKKVVRNPEELPFTLISNGLEVVIERHVFHTGEGEIDEIICPACKQNIAPEAMDFLDEWSEDKNDNIVCPLCNVSAEIHAFKFAPFWGFSDLGFTFWNWPELTDDFVNEFRQRLGCDIDLVFTWI